MAKISMRYVFDSLLRDLGIVTHGMRIRRPLRFNAITARRAHEQHPVICILNLQAPTHDGMPRHDRFQHKYRLLVDTLLNKYNIRYYRAAEAAANFLRSPGDNEIVAILVVSPDLTKHANLAVMTEVKAHYSRGSSVIFMADFNKVLVQTWTPFWRTHFGHVNWTNEGRHETWVNLDQPQADCNMFDLRMESRIYHDGTCLGNVEQPHSVYSQLRPFFPYYTGLQDVLVTAAWVKGEGAKDGYVGYIGQQKDTTGNVGIVLSMCDRAHTFYGNKDEPGYDRFDTPASEQDV